MKWGDRVVGQGKTKDLKAAEFPGLYQGGPDPPSAWGLFKQLWKTPVPSHPTWEYLSTSQRLCHPALPGSSGNTLFKQHSLRAALLLVTGPQPAWHGWKLNRNSHQSRQNTLEKILSDPRYADPV